MIRSLLIANRGEIACRIIKTARRMGISTIAIYSDADAQALHVSLADKAFRIGPAPVRESYLDAQAVLNAARLAGADAIHPGYGFLSENAEFAEAVSAAGIIFIGPPPSAIRAMGLKDQAKALMQRAGVPIVPGEFGAEQDPGFLARRALEIGYPIMIKAVAGGGGKGMRKVESPAEFDSALASAQREAQNAFGDARMMLEKFVSAPRHIEVQVFADSHGNVVHLFERDCSLQRRHQKVIEEAPAPGMTDAFRTAITQAATKAARAIGYEGAGTVEFIADGVSGLDPARVYFLEMNTRLQVEHPVTEAILGLDLVEWQLRVASGEMLPRSQAEITISGHAMEARLYAEDPTRGFLPSTGTIEHLLLPDFAGSIRVDAGITSGDSVTIYYDPMIAKIIAHGESRAEAAAKLARALASVEVIGVETNASFLANLARHPDFLAGKVETGFIERHLNELVPAAPDQPSDQALCLCVFALVQARRAAALAHDSHSPFLVLDGFRVNGPARDQSVLTFRAQPIQIGITYLHNGLKLSLGARVFEIAGNWHADGRLACMLDGQKVAGFARINLDSGKIIVLHNGVVWRFDLPDYAAPQADAIAGSAQILAPMPGKVIAVMTEIGAHVRQGTPLIVLEAMKMEHTLSAPGDGIVARLTVSVGDQVSDGALIVALEADSGEAK